jgi:hypothetical protein
MPKKATVRKFTKRNADGTVTNKTPGKTGRPGGSASAAGNPGSVPSKDMGGSSPKLVRPKNRAVPRHQPNSTEQ